MDQQDNHKQLFDGICRRHGLRPYDGSKEPDDHLETKLLLQTLEGAWRWVNEFRTIHCEKLHNIYFHYVNNYLLNAFAVFDPRTQAGFVGVYTGAVCLTYDIFYRLLSHPDVLPSIGNASAETFQKHLYSDELASDFSVVCKGRSANGDKFEGIIPKDPDRKKYAEKLAEIALEFLVLHEVSHLAVGHCEYSQSIGNPLLMEFNASPQPISPLIKQWFELVADAHAAVASWLRRLPRPTEFEKIERARWDRRPHIVVPEQLLMFDWVFATSFLFWMFDVDTDPYSLNTASHPPSVHRVLVANAHVLKSIQKNDTRDREDQFDLARMDAAKEIDKSMGIIGVTKTVEKHQIYMRLALDKTLNRHYERLADEGSKIASDLERFSRYRNEHAISPPSNIQSLFPS